MTKIRQGQGWDVRRALHQMHGMEHAARLLIADLDREVVDRDSYGISNSPRAIGIASSATLHCALLCEYAIKTFHAFLSDGTYCRGHLLVGRTDGEAGLYDHLEERYIEVENVTPGELSDCIITQLHSPEACCPSEWFADFDDVRYPLSVASANFEDWRYGYPETGQLQGGAPKGSFAVAKGIELVVRKRFLQSVLPQRV